jgi:hypothetical protein
MADPSGQSVTNGPKTILMERVVLGIFLAANSVRVELTAARAAATGHVKMNLDALWYCVFEYVPMLFYLGRMVRDCNWKSVEACPGTHARRLNQLCLVFLLHVRDTVSARREEYISGLMLQNLLWSPLHGSIPGAAHCEENLEAMIGRLSRELRSDLTCDSVEEASKVFAKMGATSDALKDLVKANLPKEFPRRVSLRLTGLISAIQTDSVPFISYGQPKTKPRHGVPCTTETPWPKSFRFPASLFAIPDVQELTTLFNRLLVNVTTGRKATRRVEQSAIDEEVNAFRLVVESEVDPPSEKVKASRAAYGSWLVDEVARQKADVSVQPRAKRAKLAAKPAPKRSPVPYRAESLLPRYGLHSTRHLHPRPPPVRPSVSSSVSTNSRARHGDMVHSSGASVSSSVDSADDEDDGLLGCGSDASGRTEQDMFSDAEDDPEADYVEVSSDARESIPVEMMQENDDYDV